MSKVLTDAVKTATKKAKFNKRVNAKRVKTNKVRQNRPLINDGLVINMNGFYASTECVKTIAGLVEQTMKTLEKILEKPELVEKYGDLILAFYVKAQSADFFLKRAKDKEDDNKEKGLTEMEYMNLLMKFIQK